MPLDPSRKFHGPAQLADFVAAIFRKDPTVQETNWVEWKSEGDLTDPRWQAEIGMQIVGFANRMPQAASANCEGFAYLVLGVEPGRAVGVKPIDPSLLHQGVTAYAGQAGPRWDPTYVSFRGVEVLIVEVAPPHWGDPVWIVRKPYSGPPLIDARPYVRRHGETGPATPAEIDDLVARARRAPRPTFDLVWRGESGLIQRIDAGSQEQQRWRTTAERALTARTSSIVRPYPSFNFSAFADTRSSEEYNKEVTDYLSAAVPNLRARALVNAARMKLGRLSFDVHNLGEDNYTDVEVELVLPGRVIACFEPDDLDWKSDLSFPEAPRARGSSALNALARLSYPGPPVTSTPPPSRGEVEIFSDSAVVTFAAEDLRPKRRARLWSIYAFSLDASLPGEIIGHWSATSKSASGEASGTVAIRLTSEEMGIGDLVTETGEAPKKGDAPSE